MVRLLRPGRLSTGRDGSGRRVGVRSGSLPRSHSSFIVAQRQWGMPLGATRKLDGFRRSRRRQAPPISQRAVPVARIRVGGRAISVAALQRARAKGNGRREPAGFRADRTDTRAHGIAAAHLALGAVVGTVALEKHRIRATRRFAVRGGPIPPATRGRPFLADLPATSDRARTSIATIRNGVPRISITTGCIGRRDNHDSGVGRVDAFGVDSRCIAVRFPKPGIRGRRRARRVRFLSAATKTGARGSHSGESGHEENSPTHQTFHGLMDSPEHHTTSSAKAIQSRATSCEIRSLVRVTYEHLATRVTRALHTIGKRVARLVDGASRMGLRSVVRQVSASRTCPALCSTGRRAAEVGITPKRRPGRSPRACPTTCSPEPQKCTPAQYPSCTRPARRCAKRLGRPSGCARRRVRDVRARPSGDDRYSRPTFAPRL